VGGLGRFLIDGLSVQDYPQMLGGSIIVVLLALISDGLFAIVQKIVVPRGVAAGAIRTTRTKDQSRAFGVTAPGRQADL
jgi:osmoprotectant transport system permease protein